MPRGGAHFSSEELVKVLSHYDIGLIHHVQSLSAGNRRAPKVVIISEQGKFLLKRRPRGKDDMNRVAFAHAVQSYLAKRDFPVTSIITTCDENSTILQLDHHVYELFKFVSGVRYDGSGAATADTGRQLANFHRYLADFVQEGQLPRGSFHDAKIVRRHLRIVGVDKVAGVSDQLLVLAERLMVLYNDSSVRVNALGFDSWPEQVVHGDWHPGNMLFSGKKLIAVLDFDSARLAPPVTDLANGMLQFSILGGRPNPSDWPDYFDEQKLIQFLSGYREVSKLDENKLNSLIDLMIETMIAEAVLPVAATGFFGNLSGSDFLKMIRRKAEWLKKHRSKLTNLIAS